MNLPHDKWKEKLKPSTPVNIPEKGKRHQERIPTLFFCHFSFICLQKNLSACFDGSQDR